MAVLLGRDTLFEKYLDFGSFAEHSSSLYGSPKWGWAINVAFNNNISGKQKALTVFQEFPFHSQNHPRIERKMESKQRRNVVVP